MSMRPTNQQLEKMKQAALNRKKRVENATKKSSGTGIVKAHSRRTKSGKRASVRQHNRKSPSARMKALGYRKGKKGIYTDPTGSFDLIKLRSEKNIQARDALSKAIPSMQWRKENMKAALRTGYRLSKAVQYESPYYKGHYTMYSTIP